MVSFAAGLSALLSSVTFAPDAPVTAQPQVSLSRDGADMVMRISLQEMTTVRGGPVSSPAGEAWRSADVTFGDTFMAGTHGVANIAVATGAGSLAQASTSISMNVRITNAGF
jgi:hypothetical protein